MKKLVFIGLTVFVIDIALQQLPAMAHPQMSGLLSITSGFRQFWIEPTELLLGIGLSGLALQRPKQRISILLLLLPIFWIIGGMAGFYAPPILILQLVTIPGFEIVGKNPDMILAVGLILAGFFVALELPMNELWFKSFVIAEGIVFGLINGLLLNGHRGALPGLVSEGGMIWLFVFVTTQLFKKLSTVWVDIAIRIAGSWIAAAGVFLFGFLIKHRQ